MLSRRHLILGAACVAGLVACTKVVPAPSYVVFFTAFSSQLSDEALDVVREAAQIARAQGDTQVIVEGYVDQAGGPAANASLSLSRAQRVADALVQAGVARDRIRLEPRGAAGDPGVVSRRVEIDITPRI